MSSGGFSPLQGMSDIAPPEVGLWQRVESVARSLFPLYGFEEIRTPILERTPVFTRAIGEGTDVVQKEMYTFDDRGGRQVSLRPEGTAGVIRALCELGPDFAEARVFYIGPMFRAERPQAGRKRQFHQIGVEALGAPSPAADAECIAMQMHLVEQWGLGGAVLHVHTRGVAADQAAVRAGLIEAVRPHLGALCEECRRRHETHPLRILDCKNPGCRAVVDTLPPVMSFMAPESRAYLDEVVARLGALGVPAQVDPRLIRGLDYYEHTIWEITHAALGAQDALAGGGRYRIDLDGRAVEGVGFAMGVERVIMALMGAGVKVEDYRGRPDLWLVAVGDRAREENLALAQQLRRRGAAVGLDTSGRSVKAQMRAANRRGAPWVAVRGDDELAAGRCQLKDMAAGAEQSVTVGELIARFAKA
ncbi:MAG: histidine--tRNA ligase [Lentisphaerae bacterium]|nr:histidine--tRNA ligase [Lentisphaerota bacterium]